MASTELAERPTYQSNPMIESLKKFNRQESRLFSLALQGQIDEQQFPDSESRGHLKSVFIPTRELRELYNTNMVYDTLRETCESIIKKTIGIEYDSGKKKGFAFFPVFSEARFDTDEGGLTITFNDKIANYILDLTHGYTMILVKETFVLRSDYAIRILELLLQYRGKAKNGIITRRIEKEELKNYLNISDERYKTNNNGFKTFVLDKPTKDINTNTDYHVEYETIKKGRFIIAYEFTLALPQEQIKPIEQLPQPNDEVTEILKQFGFKGKTLRQYAQTYSSELPFLKHQYNIFANSSVGSNSLGLAKKLLDEEHFSEWQEGEPARQKQREIAERNSEYYAQAEERKSSELTKADFKQSSLFQLPKDVQERLKA